MTTPDNPFAGLTAMRDLLTADPAPAAVVAAPSPGENPFAALNQQPPPVAPNPAPLVESACEGMKGEPTTPEASAAEMPVESAPATTPGTPPETPLETSVEEPKQKRRPGRPRKKPVEDASVSEAPKDRATYLRDIAATEAPPSAFAKLTVEVSSLEETRDALAARVADVSSRIAESTASHARVTAQIEELTKFLDTLGEQVQSLQDESDAKTSELTAVEEELAVAVESLDRVRDFIVALSGGKSGTIGGVRVTVLDGTTHIETL